jgi:hypothetical protein
MGVVWARFGVVLTAGLLLSPHVGAQQAADADTPQRRGQTVLSDRKV